MTLCIPQKVEAYRVCQRSIWSSNPGDSYGAFDDVPGPCGEKLNILVSDALPDDPVDCWEHVSVSLARVGKARVPNWEEMCFVKDLFWDPEDCVVQFHPPKSEHVNNYRVLHLWRSIRHEFPQPPGWMIGIKTLGELPV